MNNERVRKWLQLSITGAVVLVSVALAYATLRQQVTTTAGIAVAAKEKADVNERTIIGMQYDINDIKETSGKILTMLNEMSDDSESAKKKWFIIF